MQYLPAILTALVLSGLAYALVLGTMNLAIAGLGKSGLPLMPKFSGNGSSLSDLDFEEFVVERFDPGHFRLMKWGRKYGPRIYPVSAERGPDLQYQALVHKQVIPFAVECDWKPQFTDGNLSLEDIRLFQNYRPAGAERELSVFLLIGIGGTQRSPAECYILPMSVIDAATTALSADFLQPYRRPQAESILFLDVNRMILK